VQEEAKRQWDLLESDPALAGPWRQLFRQVQSPRHVLSELLQNADDAGATKAHAKIVNNVFEFTHNGEDFNEASLRSLCRFGFSNKRHLHTIGFRGVGFKSTFSLGPRVEVHTPTLGFSFHHLRFTEPKWISNYQPVSETVIRVAFDKETKEKALLTEFKRWFDTPHPLLFFKNILRLKIQLRLIYKEILGPGPTHNSEKIWLANPHKQEVLCFRSEPVDFPQEALEEIREERGSQDFEVPPFTVQIVLGGTAAQHLFTVLPTEVRLQIPFAVNGPFIQDPSRKEIKHPANSPTNTLILKKLSHLAEEALEEWLNNTNLELSERAQAYALIPVPISSDGSLGDESTRILVEELGKHLTAHKSLLLSHDGSLSKSADAVAFPEEVLDTWDPKEALNIFAPDKRRVFFRGVDSACLRVLAKWSLIEVLEKRDIANRLLSYGSPGPPRPQPIERLVYLWNLLHDQSDDWSFRQKIKQFPVVPVGNKEEMLPAEKVLVVGGKESRISSSDWAFLMRRADIIDPDCIKLFSKVNRDEQEVSEFEPYEEPTHLTEEIRKSVDLFRLMKLTQNVGLERVVDSVSKNIFRDENPGASGIRIAHVAARGGTSISEVFKFLCGDGKWRSVKNELIAEGENDLPTMVPEKWYESNVIASDYRRDLSENDIEIWDGWVWNTNKSGLLGFPIPKYKRVHFSERSVIEEFCDKRGGKSPVSYRLKTSNFGVEEFDWDEELWEHWKRCAQEDQSFWTVLAWTVLKNWSKSWHHRTNAVVRQIGPKREYRMECGVLRSAWIEKLQSLPCIPDTFGKPSIPAQLCRSTVDTRPLQNVERFVHAEFDKVEYEEILDLLGVRKEAKSIAPLLDRLRTLSRVEQPPISGIVDLYRAIDQVLLRVEPDDAEQLRAIFSAEPIIHTEDGEWEKLGNVFKGNPDHIPGVRTIHREAQNLAMWDRLKVVGRPTLEMAVEWLRTFKKGERLLKSEKNRAIEVIRRAPLMVWQECGGWLDASGQWTDNRDFKWAATDRRITHDLFDTTRKCIADFSILRVSASEFIEKIGLVRLDSALEQRIRDCSPAASFEKPLWLETLGKILSRLCCRDEDSGIEEEKTNIDADRMMGLRLANSKWLPVLKLTMVPYLEGQPAGAERSSKVTWQNDSILIAGEAASNHRELVAEIARQFLTSEAREAVKDCVDRDPEWIAVYAREHLELESSMHEPETYTDENEKSSDPEEFGEPLGTKTFANFDDEDGFEEIMKIRKKRQESKKQFFIQFMEKDDFKWSDVRSCLVHPDGTVIVKATAPFHWAASLNGIQESLFWVGKGSIEEGIEIPSEVWNWPSRNKSEVYLFLMNKDDTPVIHAMAQLNENAKAGEIDLFPSKYLVRAKGR
jgi:hypothetical protein